MKGARLAVFAAVMGVAVGVLNAWQLADRIRPVDIVSLFASGMAAGAGLVKALIDMERA